MFPRFDDCQLSAQQSISDMNKGFTSQFFEPTFQTLTLPLNLFIPKALLEDIHNLFKSDI